MHCMHSHLRLCTIVSQLYIAIPPCIYFLNFLDHCTVALFVLYCVVMYILCKHIKSHFTSPSQIPCLCKLTCPIKPDCDSDSEGASHATPGLLAWPDFGFAYGFSRIVFRS